MAKNDRRLLQRFTLKAFSVLRTGGGSRLGECALCTQDLSSGGAFFPTRRPLPTGERVRVTLYVPIRAHEQLANLPGQAMVMTDGEVVRSGARGMAIKFAGKFSICPAPKEA